MDKKKESLKPCDALVLSARDISHSNRVLTLLTREHGVLDVFANSSKNPKSKIMGLSQPFVSSRMILSKSGQNYTLQSGEIDKIYYKIREDMDALLLSFYLAEITCEFAPKSAEASEYYELFSLTLAMLEKKEYEKRQVKLIYELKLLSLSGFMPNFLGCKECLEYDKNGMRFYLRSGVISCENCLGENSLNEPFIDLNRSAMRALRHVIFSEKDKIFSFDLKGKSLDIAEKACELYLYEQAGRTYKTLEFYKKMSGKTKG